MGSTRLAGKVLEPIEGRPLIVWTLAALGAVIEIERIVVATTVEPEDDRLATMIRKAGWPIHRGSSRDVLARCWEAVASMSPGLVVRATADNPFPDPLVVAGQIRRTEEGGFDYVGTEGWPLGIAVEVARAEALEIADREALDPAEREHVMPFLYRRPERFKIGSYPPPTREAAGRFTVDTVEDLAFVRAVAARLDPDAGPPSLDDLRAVVDREPALLELNRSVRQKSWRETQA
jgi:spore coat polysaccharide biosynthesis protein SpsF